MESQGLLGVQQHPLRAPGRYCRRALRLTMRLAWPRGSNRWERLGSWRGAKPTGHRPSSKSRLWSSGARWRLMTRVFDSAWHRGLHGVHAVHRRAPRQILEAVAEARLDLAAGDGDQPAPSQGQDPRGGRGREGAGGHGGSGEEGEPLEGRRVGESRLRVTKGEVSMEAETSR